MAGTVGIQRFVSSQAFERRREAGAGTHPFVTVSRQAGAGGRTLAVALLEAFARRRDAPGLAGWRWADRQVLDELAGDPRLGVRLESLLDDEFRGEADDYLRQVFAGTAPQLQVYHALFRSVRSLAEAGRIVVVGRGGVCATAGLPGGVHVRLVGPREERVLRVARQRGWKAARAAQWVARHDAARARLFKACFNADVDDPGLYDAVFNIDRYKPAAIAEAVTELVLQRCRAEAAV